ncbi:MAPEG family protein [Pseudoduganella sp. LjRoot289]|uniref:MAPEG family protein n=1 Tax=Pseudoduganella sp. LjRoot289 TaxID=3342314 RepID=UPI003ECEA1C8
MTVANWCIVAACVLPNLTALLPKAASIMQGRKADGGIYDNKMPRDWSARQTGWKKRALAAHLNGYEALPLFVAAVLLAQTAHVDQARVDMLALAFIGIRVLYSAVYMANSGWLRTLLWLAGLGDSIYLLAQA